MSWPQFFLCVCENGAVCYIKYPNYRFLHTFNGILCILKLNTMYITCKWALSSNRISKFSLKMPTATTVVWVLWLVGFVLQNFIESVIFK
jgi:hypothetical protein